MSTTDPAARGGEREVIVRFDAITLFAPMFEAITAQGITGRALQRGLWSLCCWNPRDFASDMHRSVDDRTYGGGPGMVMMPEPLVAAIRCARADRGGAARVIHPSPQGRPVTDEWIRGLHQSGGAILLCGRYEGVDQRVLDTEVDEQVCVGDLVVSGGELPAMMLIDAVVRRVPGAMNDAASAHQESFVDGLLDCPHYTRPEVFEGHAVPEVLRSGHHERIARWRRRQSLALTRRLRPDLLAAARRNGLLTPADERWLALGVEPDS